jgi:uncharacterized delta-60 repeat protein
VGCVGSHWLPHEPITPAPDVRYERSLRRKIVDDLELKMLKISRVTLFLSVFLFTQLLHAIPGKPGTLDATWATTSSLGAGKLLLPSAALNCDSNNLVVQADGKVLLYGRRISGGAALCAVRLNSDGSVDPTFGTNGVVFSSASLSPTSTFSYAVVQPYQYFFLASTCTQNTLTRLCATRFGPNGTLSEFFGNTGVASFGTADALGAITLTPNDELIFAARCNGDFCIYKLAGDGSLVNSFGTSGRVTTTFGSGDDTPSAVVVQTDGKIVVAGVCKDTAAASGLQDRICIARYSANGAIDTTFAVNGKIFGNLLAPTNKRTTIRALKIQPDGKLLVAGVCQNGTDQSTTNFCVARYAANGSLEYANEISDANANGTTYADRLVSIALQPDGRILLGGACESQGEFCVRRLNPDLFLDYSFGAPGLAVAAVGMQSTNDVPIDMAMQADGKVLVSGLCIDGFTAINSCALRYDGGPFGYQNCKPDLDGDGVFLATTDTLMWSRISLGLRGDSVIGGINFAASASRKTWPAIRDYLVAQCGLSIAP